MKGLQVVTLPNSSKHSSVFSHQRMVKENLEPRTNQLPRPHLALLRLSRRTSAAFAIMLRARTYRFGETAFVS